MGAATMERLDLRVRAEAKERIRRAATIQGKSLTEFILDTAEAAAAQVIARHRTITLTERDFDRFMAALDEEPHPNQALRRAAERYNEDPL